MNKFLIEKLKTARLEKDMKQSDIADILGVKKNTISNYENGKTNPDIDTLVKMCEVYEIDCAKLLESSYHFGEKVNNFDSFLSSIERKLVKSFREFNEDGQLKIFEYMDDLNISGKYSKNNLCEIGSELKLSPEDEKELEQIKKEMLDEKRVKISSVSPNISEKNTEDEIPS